MLPAYKMRIIRSFIIRGISGMKTVITKIRHSAIIRSCIDEVTVKASDAFARLLQRIYKNFTQQQKSRIIKKY